MFKTKKVRWFALMLALLVLTTGIPVFAADPAVNGNPDDGKTLIGVDAAASSYEGGVKLTGTVYGTAGEYMPGTGYDKVFDGNTSTYFDCTQPDNAYAGIDLGEGQAANVTLIRFVPRPDWKDRMIGGKFQGSNTSQTEGFTDLYTVTATPATGWNEVAISDATQYRYLRYISGTWAFGNIVEAEFYTGTTVTPTPTVVPVTPTPTTVPVTPTPVPQLITVDAASHPYVKNDGGTQGSWGERKADVFPFFAFNNSTGWWNDGWNWMYDNAGNTGDYMEFYFKGSYIGLYMGKLPWGGIVDVYIDDIKQATVDTYDGATTETDNSVLVFENNTLADTKHKLKLVVAGKNASITGDAFAMVKGLKCSETATATAPTPQLITVDSITNPYIRDNGGTEGPWNNRRGDKFPFLAFSDASGWWSDSWNWMYNRVNIGQYVDFYFKGSYIGLYLGKAPWGGVVDIYVDGIKQAAADTYDAAAGGAGNPVLVFEKNNLPDGSHKLRVEIAGKNANITGDAFVAVKGFTCYETSTAGGGDTWTEPGIRVNSLPKRLVYGIGEAFDPFGLDVTYYDGVNAPGPIAVTADMLSGFDSETAGAKTVTVTYNGYTANFSVKVIDKIISVISPRYYSDINENTITVEFNAPGFTQAKAESLHAPDGVNANPYGYMKSVADNIQLSADKYGKGTFTFNAADFPNGPVSIHINASNGNGQSDDCYLQLLNHVGVEWDGGAGNTYGRIPKAIADNGLDMETVFQDDFSEMPTISYTGAGDVKYAAAKPDATGWPEYGDSKFTPPNYSYNDVVNNYTPFAISDGKYMQMESKYWGKVIEPNWGQTYTSSFISSMGNDGSGFVTKPGAAQYFEARLFLPPNPGLWPAFWTLTPPDGRTGCDELDILEAYMGGNPTTITENYHTWEYADKGSGNAADTSGFGNGVNLAEGWHTYGMLVTEDMTYCYFDDQLIEGSATHTLNRSWTVGSYFMINTAYRQYDSDKYPGGFQRYGNTAEMYVDWVKVYQVQNQGFTPMFTKFDVTPGSTVAIDIMRDDTVKELAGTYNIALPEGWTIASGETFAAGSSKDTIVLNVPAECSEFQGGFSITPVSGSTQYDTELFRFKTEGLYSTEVNVALNGTGDGYIASFKLNNYLTKALNHIVVTAKGPEGWTQSQTIPVIDAKGAGIAAFPIPKPDLYKTVEYTFDVALAADYVVTVKRPISGLVAPKAQTPLTIDGVIHPSELQGAMSLTVDQSSEPGTAWTGPDDLKAGVNVKWDEDYLYVVAEVTDNIHDMKQDSIVNAWQGDCMQISLDPARRKGPASGGWPHLSFTAALNSNTGANGVVVDRCDYPELGLNWSQALTQSKCVVKRDEGNKTTTYTLAFAWPEIMPAAYRDATDLGISIVFNDSDGAGRKGWIRYMDGIAVGKDPSRFGDVVLSNLTDLSGLTQENTPPVLDPIGAKSVKEGDTLEFTVNASDADNDSLNYSASGLPAGAAFNAATGVFTWKPDFTQAGAYQVRFTVSDGSLSVYSDVEITVNAVSAKELATSLREYVNALDINILTKKLLAKQLENVESSLDKEQYKLALVKLKVFILEVKALSPKIISGVQAGSILKSGLDICMAIKADAQGKDSKWVDRHVNSLMDLFKTYQAGQITEDIWEKALKGIDDLAGKMK